MLGGGNAAERRHAKFAPDGVGRTFIPMKDGELTGATDEWLNFLWVRRGGEAGAPVFARAGKNNSRHEDGKMLQLYWPIAKLDQEARLVYGYASTEAKDSQGEIVKKEALEAALPGYMRFANIREMHQPSA
ncbi:MAG: hypothetical protein ACREFQ_05175, partial [Stellaceae bacterium]